MKKVIILTVLIALATGGLGAQNFNYTSLSNNFSAGLFPSVLDQALTVNDAGYGPGFGMLGHNYLLGGVSNLNADQAGNTGGPILISGAPVILGVYRENSLPWSMVTGLDFSPITGEPKSSTAETLAGTTTVTVGTTDTDYPVFQDRTVTENEARCFQDFTAQLQFLIKLSSIMTGLYFNLAMVDGAEGLTNYTSTVTTFYDAAAVPGTDIPVNTVDYTETTTETNMFDGANSTDCDFTVAIPVSMELDSMRQYGNLYYRRQQVDNSNSLKEEVVLGGSNQSALPAANYNDDAVVDILSTNTFGLDYTLYRGSFLNSHPESLFHANLGFEVILTGGENETTNIDQTYSSPGAGGAIVPGSRLEDTTTFTVDSTFGFDVGFEVGESIYHDFGPMITFGLMPTLSGGFARSYASGSAGRSVQVIRDDVDNDGAFTSAVDTIQTITTTFTDANSAGGNLSYTDTLEVSFTLPTALKFHPEGWICGFILSNTPTVTYSRATNKTLTATSEVTDHNINGDGSGEATVITKALGATETITSDADWSLINTTSLGAEFYLPNDILLLVDINGNLWEPEGFTIQAVVPADFLFQRQ